VKSNCKQDKKLNQLKSNESSKNWKLPQESAPHKPGQNPG
jgi:hypothetical protein